MPNPWHHPELVVPDIVCVVVCLVAVVTDLRDRRIPNWLNLSAVVVGLAINTLFPLLLSNPVFNFTVGLVSSLTGGLLLLIIFGFLGMIRFVGMGDVKLMAAVGVLLRWPTALWALAYVALAGGVVAVFYTLTRGRLRAVAGNLFKISARLVTKKGAQNQDVELHRIPYALAIFIGATWAAGIKYFPFLVIP